MDHRQVGQQVPEVRFRVREGGAWTDVTTRQLFSGKRVVLFALPGAFTPTCSSSHVPRYQELFPRFQAAGVDAVYCLSVNDSFVMNAWKADQGAVDIGFIPDGNGVFTEQMGFLVDKSDLGFGRRSWRYAMIVNDGVIERLFVEEERAGDPFDVSDADTVLAALGGTTTPDVLLVTRPGCAHCERAKAALDAKDLAYAEVPSSPRTLRALPGARTTPQVFVDGRHLGGADELIAWLTDRG
jgi:peroxiredoxin/glutaredoxin